MKSDSLLSTIAYYNVVHCHTYSRNTDPAHSFSIKSSMNNEHFSDVSEFLLRACNAARLQAKLSKQLTLYTKTRIITIQRTYLSL